MRPGPAQFFTGEVCHLRRCEGSAFTAGHQVGTEERTGPSRILLTFCRSLMHKNESFTRKHAASIDHQGFQSASNVKKNILPRP